MLSFDASLLQREGKSARLEMKGCSSASLMLCVLFSCRSWKVYEAADPLQGFIQQLLKARNLPADTAIEVRQVSKGAHVGRQ